MIHFFTEIHLGRLVLRDPMTVLTNILIFLAGAWCWRQVRGSSLQFVRSWSLFFLLIGLSSLIGVVVHGFSYYTPERTHFWIWITMGLVQNLGITFAQIGTAQHYFPKQRRWITALVLLQYVVTGALFIYFESYKAVKWQIAIGLLPVMGWNISRWVKGDASGKWIVLGILVSALTAAVHGFKLSLDIHWFNYNDIAHVLIVISLLLINKGVRLLK